MNQIGHIKAQIITYLTNHPYTRKRDIAAGINQYHLSRNFRAAMIELEAEQAISHQPYSDPANMEFYDLYFIKK